VAIENEINAISAVGRKKQDIQWQSLFPGAVIENPARRVI
jgi:hypothetical protein